MKRIVFITPDDAEYGFKLTGVSHYVTGSEDIENTIMAATGQPDTGIVIIDERLLKGIAEEKVKEIEKRWKGILLILPSPERPEVEFEDYTSRLIRRAIGYHVRLKL
jgi:V/A-type H+-transporting ATPase subunit F